MPRVSAEDENSTGPISSPQCWLLSRSYGVRIPRAAARVRIRRPRDCIMQSVLIIILLPSLASQDGRSACHGTTVRCKFPQDTIRHDGAGRRHLPPRQKRTAASVAPLVSQRLNRSPYATGQPHALHLISIPHLILRASHFLELLGLTGAAKYQVPTTYH